jgi:hypothetical protein
MSGEQEDELVEGASGETIPPAPKRNENQFDKIPIDISLEELKAEGALKMLLSERDSLKSENKELREIQKKYYKDQKLIGKCEVKAEKLLSFEFLRDLSIVFGGVFLGLASCNINQGKYDLLFLLLGIALTALSLLTKWVGSIISFFSKEK